MRDLAFAILKQSGYDVLVAESGQEALSLPEAHDGPLHLILTDEQVVTPAEAGVQKSLK